MQKPYRQPSPDTQKLIDETNAWLRSDTGRAELNEILRRAAVQSRKFREDSRVDPATLRIPMDV
jgi:hypothetical protein